MNYEEAKVTVTIKYFSNLLKIESERTRNFVAARCITTPTEIESIIMSLSSTKASCPFSISISLLKTLKGVLSIPLQLPFNCSFSTGLVPDQFKVARVVPIHKKGSSYLVSN